MTLGNVDVIVDHDQKIKTLNGRKTSRRACLHFQKTHILPTGNFAVSETATSNYEAHTELPTTDSCRLMVGKQ